MAKITDISPEEVAPKRLPTCGWCGKEATVLHYNASVFRNLCDRCNRETGGESKQIATPTK